MKIRLKNYRTFKNLFENQNWCHIQKINKNSLSSWFGFNLILKGQLKNKRKKIVNILTKNQIEVRPTMTGNFLKSVMKYLNFKQKVVLKIQIILIKMGFLLETIKRYFKTA